MDMYDVYINARKRYIEALDNIQDLIIHSRPEVSKYYVEVYKRYGRKLRWVTNKLDKTFH